MVFRWDLSFTLYVCLRNFKECTSFIVYSLSYSLSLLSIRQVDTALLLFIQLDSLCCSLVFCLTSQILTIRRILEGVRTKNLEAIILSVSIFKAFDPIHRRKMGQILHAYGLPKETVKAIMMLFKNTKVKVRSPERDKDYFDIVAGGLQGNTLALYLFIICLDYVLRTSIDIMKDNGFNLAKERSRRYPA